MSKPSLVLNTILLIIELIVQIWSVFEIKSRMLKLYTQHSNILAMLSAFLYVIFYRRGQIPIFVNALRFMSTSMLIITLLVVVFVMAPYDSKSLGIKESYRRHVFDRRMPILHVICPLLSFVSYMMYENNSPILIWYVFFPGAYTFLYIFVIGVLTYRKKIEGPYSILKIKQQPVYMTIILIITVPVAAILIALLIYILKVRITYVP